MTRAQVRSAPERNAPARAGPAGNEGVQRVAFLAGPCRSPLAPPCLPRRPVVPAEEDGSKGMTDRERACRRADHATPCFHGNSQRGRDSVGVSAGPLTSVRLNLRSRYLGSALVPRPRWAIWQPITERAGWDGVRPPLLVPLLDVATTKVRIKGTLLCSWQGGTVIVAIGDAFARTLLSRSLSRSL